MKYQEQLNSNEWKARRLEILKRDGNKCQECFNLNYLNELRSGIFTDYCFTDRKDAVKIETFDEEVGVNVRVDSAFPKTNFKFSILYFGINPKGKLRLYGSRTPLKVEKELLKEYKSQWNDVFNHYLKGEIKTIDIKKSISERNQKIQTILVNNDIENYKWHYLHGLHIHHEYYINNLKLWEYNDEALTTLCFHCHENLHKNKKVPVYNIEFELIGEYSNCKRCHGAGWFPEFKHVESGICFECRGARYQELIK